MSEAGLIYEAFFKLRESGVLPYGYVDALQREVMQAHIAWNERRRPHYCYLAFFGSGDTAHFLKVGISVTPQTRIKGFACGNPLKPLWSLAVECSSLAEARLIEQGTLRFLADKRVEGEWVRLGAMGEREALNFVQEISAQCGAEFNPIEGYNHAR